MVLNDPTIALVQLSVAHIMVDFFLQPRSWIEDRRKLLWRSRRLYYHALLAGIVPFILLGSLDNWPLVPVFALTHLIIDGVKCRYEDNTKVFIADQAAHFAVIVLVWLLAFNAGITLDMIIDQLGQVWSDPNIWVVLLGGGLLTTPASIFIGKVMMRWEPSDDKVPADAPVSEVKAPDVKGLEDAGRIIGITERIIIFALILAGQFTVIGFVIATKSIFRLKEGSTRAEYYLVGSMLSFSLAIATGLLVQYLLSQPL